MENQEDHDPKDEIAAHVLKRYGGFKINILFCLRDENSVGDKSKYRDDRLGECALLSLSCTSRYRTTHQFDGASPTNGTAVADFS